MDKKHRPNITSKMGLIKAMVAVTLLLLIATCFLRLLSLTQTNHSLPVSGKHTSHTDFFELKTFIETFEAAHPEWTERCKAYLRSPAQYNFDRLNRSSFINWEWEFSQYGQDWILFVNWLHTRGRTGFYVESGANSALRVSNTAFYDLCMGWRGLCVEPTTQYHQELRELRTCHLEPVCLSYREETINMEGENPTRDAVENSNPVKCERIDTLLRKYNVSHVDLWSLDIEGFEMNALRGWRGISFPDILLMEQQDMGGNACSQMGIDYRLTAMGYDKHRFVSDGIYVRRETGPLRVPNRTVLDGYARELEDPRCKNMGKELLFFDLE
jgi:FkbM family methyltransferase